MNVKHSLLSAGRPRKIDLFGNGATLTLTNFPHIDHRPIEPSVCPTSSHSFCTPRVCEPEISGTSTFLFLEQVQRG